MKLAALALAVLSASTINPSQPTFSSRVDGVRVDVLVTDGSRFFLVYPNYEALLAYTCATSYAISVAMLSDRLK